jgi:hypothetical protein
MTLPNLGPHLPPGAPFLGGRVFDQCKAYGVCVMRTNGDDELADNSLGMLLGRVSEKPEREIEDVIDQLQTLHNKLEADRSRIHRDIVEYTGISQQVMQLTTIISDSVKSLPSRTGR